MGRLHKHGHFERDELTRRQAGMGWEPEPAPPLEAPTSRASRPDLLPAFAMGFNGARDMYMCSNVQPDSKVATNGAAKPDSAPADFDRHGRANRRSPGR